MTKEFLKTPGEIHFLKEFSDNLTNLFQSKKWKLQLSIFNDTLKNVCFITLRKIVKLHS